MNDTNEKMESGVDASFDKHYDTIYKEVFARKRKANFLFSPMNHVSGGQATNHYVLTLAFKGGIFAPIPMKHFEKRGYPR
jgi:hypothetical protein